MPPQKTVPTVSTSQTRRSRSAFQPKYVAMPPQMPAIHLLLRERVSLSCVITKVFPEDLTFSFKIDFTILSQAGVPYLDENLGLSVGKGMLNISTLQYIVL